LVKLRVFHYTLGADFSEHFYRATSIITSKK
jgi:hypothetical protein